MHKIQRVNNHSRSLSKKLWYWHLKLLESKWKKQLFWKQLVLIVLNDFPVCGNQLYHLLLHLSLIAFCAIPLLSSGRWSSKLWIPNIPIFLYLAQFPLKGFIQNSWRILLVVPFELAHHKPKDFIYIIFLWIPHICFHYVNKP